MVFVELQYLGAYLVETERHGFSLDEAAWKKTTFHSASTGTLKGPLRDPWRWGWCRTEVFEIVQYEGNCLPRLYLLVTVGMVSDPHSKLILFTWPRR